MRRRVGLYTVIAAKILKNLPPTYKPSGILYVCIYLALSFYAFTSFSVRSYDYCESHFRGDQFCLLYIYSCLRVFFSCAVMCLVLLQAEGRLLSRVYGGRREREGPSALVYRGDQCDLCYHCVRARYQQTQRPLCMYTTNPTLTSHMSYIFLSPCLPVSLSLSVSQISV